MGSYKAVSICKNCGKIYAHGIPEICYKCGVRLGYEGIFTAPVKLTLTDDCEKIIARRKLFKGWEIKED